MLRRLMLFLLVTLPAQAVIVRGHVTTPLGAPVPGARVQLIQGARNVGDTITGADGAYEIRTSLSGRFLLLTSASLNALSPAVQIGSPFYGGRTDLLTFEIALDPAAITPQESAQPTLRDTPLAQLASATAQVRPDELLTHATVVPELRTLPGVFLVQRDSLGSPALLYLRGAAPNATKTMVDGVSAEDLGGGFEFGAVSASGLASLAQNPAAQLTPGADPLYGLDAEAGVVSLHTSVAQTLHPTVIYTGDAGNLGTLRNEADVTLARSRVDFLGSFARFDTAGNTPASPFHLATSAVNLGYFISAGTSLRLTLRDEVSASPIPMATEFFGLTPSTKLAEQNLYSGFTFDTRTAGNWHNLLRFGLARKREQAYDFFTPFNGLPVTITGANGYTASGTAVFVQLPAREDMVTNRDEYSYQTDYKVKPWLTALATVRFQDERGADLTLAKKRTVERSHLTAAVSLQGEIRDRFFYEASGFLDHGALLGFRGAPRLGLTYVPVRPGVRRFRGTALHATAATGVREPSLEEQFAMAGQLAAPRSRTFDVSADQNILGQKLTVRATYFHSQFSHQTETLALEPLTLGVALAFRSQGFESDLRFQPFPRMLLHGGYTYLASLVEQSAASPMFDPALPGLPIGALTALTGSRPFHRPPNGGFLSAEYTGSALTATLKGTLAGRSDGSTELLQTPALLLPNRNLSPGFVSLDASVTYALTRHMTAFSQLTNLSDSRHIAPFGYVSTPFLIRSGLRIRLGRE